MDPRYITIAFAVICSLVLLSCNKQENGNEQPTGQPGETASEEAPAELPEQQQNVPTGEEFKVDQEQMEERGSTNSLPAGWPAELTIPDGAEISQAASREGYELVEFSVDAPLSEVSASLAADASIAGFRLRQAEVDKYTQKRRYTSEEKEYSTAISEVEGKCFVSLTLGPLNPGQYYSGATNFTGEFSLPSSWPSDMLPIYEGCVLRELFIPIEEGGRLMLSAQTNDSEDAVIAWVEQQFPGFGWTATASQSRNGFSIRKFDGHGYELSVAARGIDGLTDIQYEATFPAPQQ